MHKKPCAIILKTSCGLTRTYREEKHADQVRQSWQQLSSAERVVLITQPMLFGAGALAGAMANVESRQWALGLLNSQVISVGRVIPHMDWLSLEINTENNNIMFGQHVDAGRLLEPLGFGPSTPSAIGAPPTPQPFVPGEDLAYLRRCYQVGCEDGEIRFDSQQNIIDSTRQKSGFMLISMDDPLTSIVASLYPADKKDFRFSQKS
jgi:hypothetical protein